MAQWLTENLDRTPFSYNLEKLTDNLSAIDSKRNELNEYWKTHPELHKSFIVDNDRRHLQCALSFLGLEDNEQMDIIPTSSKNEYEQMIEDEKLRKAHAYREACEYVHRCALNIEPGMENCGLEADMLIKSHSMLCSYDSDNYRQKARMRFRNEDDGLIIVGRGVFNPVEGDLVDIRMQRLFELYNCEWYNEHPIVKGTKFLLEYIRIQPHLDGNKRVALMALNFILERDGYPSIYLDSNQYDTFIKIHQDALLSRDITQLCKMLTLNIFKAQRSLQNKIILHRTERKLERMEQTQAVEKIKNIQESHDMSIKKNTTDDDSTDDTTDDVTI